MVRNIKYKGTLLTPAILSRFEISQKLKKQHQARKESSGSDEDRRDENSSSNIPYQAESRRKGTRQGYIIPKQGRIINIKKQKKNKKILFNP